MSRPLHLGKGVRRCDACWHWLRLPVNIDCGECRAEPPGLRNERTGSPLVNKEWPVTGGSDWCGGFTIDRRPA